MKKAYLDMIHWKTTQKRYKIRVIWRIFLETISGVKEEGGTASADCQLGGSKHKIFKWQHRIVKQ
jgi:hypothetical protein